MRRPVARLGGSSGAGGPPLGGADAVDALGPEGIAAVAELAGQPAADLRDLLLADPTVRVDGCGMLLAVDAGAPAARPGEPTAPAAPGPFPFDQTFTLHSRPGADRVLYLDFEGEAIPASSGWANSYNGGQAFLAVPYDIDGSPGTFAAAERDVVQAVWQRVSEDFRPFDIDVTTEDPGADAIDRMSVDDLQYGARALITNDTVIGGACGCGGVAVIDIFNRTRNGVVLPGFNDSMPAWIFPNGSSRADHLAELVSHEVGHTLGLTHDGQPGVTYYVGHGPWAPIMGTAYNRAITQWSRGEYAGATNAEDDLAVIATGAPVVPDEAGATVDTAAVLAPGPYPEATGIIASGGDQDVYRFTASGPTTISVRGVGAGANLDIRADLATLAGATLAFDDPPAMAVTVSTASGLDAVIAMDLAAGDYVVGIDGVGFEDPLSAGYSDFGSVGGYRLEIATDVAEPGAPFHPLVPDRVLDSRPGGVNVGDYATPWGSGASGIRDVQIAGRGGVPTGATAVVLNVTVVNPTSASFLQLWPTGGTQPTFGSNLNFGSGQIVPNAVTVALGHGGKVRVFNAVGSTDVVIDVAGYYGEGGGAGFTAVTPARVVDSRPGASNVGAYSTPWAAGVAGIRDVQVGGLGGVPADAEAVVLNVTVVNPDARSFLQLWPTGSTQPRFGSSLNFEPGQIVPNQVTVTLGTGGNVQVFNAAGNVDVVVDVSGYYAAGTGKAFHPVLPGRVLDSRPGGTNIGAYTTPWAAGSVGVRSVAVGGLVGVPVDADAVVMNVTVVNATAQSFLQIWPDGTARPSLGSSLNFDPGQIVPNAVTVKLGTIGQVSVFNAAGHVDVIADVAGYFD